MPEWYTLTGRRRSCDACARTPDLVAVHQAARVGGLVGDAEGTA
jgi:hypothetical protein